MISGILNLSVSQYAAKTVRDSKNYNLTLSSNHQYSERSALNLKIKSLRETSQENDIGTVTPERRQRNQQTINPSWSYNLTQKIFLSLNYQYGQTRYSGYSTLTDYNIHNLTTGLNYSYNARNQFGINIASSLYSSGENIFINSGAISTSNYDLSAVYAHDFSETFNASASIGSRYTENTRTAGFIFAGNLINVNEYTLYGSGMTFSGSLKKQFQKVLLNAKLSRNVSPSSTGGMSLNDNISVTSNYSWDEKLSFNLGFASSFIQNNNINTTISDRSSLRLLLGMSWKFNKQLRLGLNYSHRRQDNGYGDGYAPINNIDLRLEYRPVKTSISR
ncbi:MAG: hypothetical protein GXP22_04945 [Gammaproteobacteria bacterium]|nr:hypothetical protein [Gammaproteobacteria bacterium]